MDPLIRAEQLGELMARKPVVLLDARGGVDARQRFERRSLPGATFVDLETELSTKRTSAAEGGRHPLPSAIDFARRVAGWGITSETCVVVYDDKSGANAAARCWWMLRAIGHTKVAVLDGGLAAVPEGFEWPISRSTTLTTTTMPAQLEWQWPTATMAEVQLAAADSNRVVVDVREGFRFRGESEPIDLVAGHIPGAVNCAFLENLDLHGKFLSREALRLKYSQVLDGRSPEQAIVHCGSGVTACHTLLALTIAGLEGAKLYVGSWSEWSRNDKPIATGS
jgi:thiosulfate/3-mercaptopyruvate sulfurtransferase